MKFPVAAAAALAASLITVTIATAATDTVAGTWAMKGKISAFAFTLTCKFDQHGETLSGTCYDGGTNKPHPLKSGSVTDGKVRWTYQSNFLTRKFDVNYIATVSGGDKMNGEVKAPGYTGVFSGERP